MQTQMLYPVLSDMGSASLKSIVVEQYQQLTYLLLPLTRSAQKSGPVPSMVE